MWKLNRQPRWLASGDSWRISLLSEICLKRCPYFALRPSSYTSKTSSTKSHPAVCFKRAWNVSELLSHGDRRKSDDLRTRDGGITFTCQTTCARLVRLVYVKVMFCSEVRVFFFVGSGCARWDHNRLWRGLRRYFVIFWLCKRDKMGGICVRSMFVVMFWWILHFFLLAQQLQDLRSNGSDIFSKKVSAITV